MRLPRSLQWRLSLWLGAGVALLWAAAAAITAQRLHREMDSLFDSALEQTAQRILPLAVVDIAGRDYGDEPDQRIPALRRHDEYFTYIVRDTAGAVLLRSHNADPAQFPPFAGTGFSSTATARLYSDSAVQGTITITVAEPLAHRHAVTNDLLLRLTLPPALAIPLSLAVVWGVVRVSIEPLRRFRSGIEARGGGDLTAVATGGLPDEVRPVALAVNHLLDRLRRVLEAERSFTANSAHELRTPVAAALAQTQRLIAEARDETTRERAHHIEAALRRLSRLSEKLLQLARAEGGRLQAAAPVDLAIILRVVADDMTRLTDGAGRIELVLPVGAVWSRMDPDAFAIVARNLIENALKHGAPELPVRVTLSADRVLRVTNAGPVVPPGLLARLSEPFERGRARVAGAGLGLAIAKAVASGTGGRIELASPPAGLRDGFEARFVIGA